MVIKKVDLNKPKPLDQELTELIYNKLINDYDYKLSSLDYALTRIRVKELISLIKDRNLLELLLLVAVDQYKANYKATSTLHIGTISSFKNRIPVPERAYKYALMAYKEPLGSTLQKQIDYWIGYWIDTGDEIKAIKMLELADIKNLVEMNI